jgi:16S rRNA (cytosine1402-N4)-methyltransferase
MSTHQPVLLQESIDALQVKPDGVYIDGTFGRGGHSRALLSALGEKGRLIAIDKDLDALNYAKEAFTDDKRFTIYHDSFAHTEDVANKEAVHGKVDGVLLDLGVSSPQLDEAIRGFSFMQDGPLDMRMNTSQGISAREWVNSAEPDEIARVLKDFGEERFSKRIAKAIVAFSQQQEIKTTRQLAEIVSKANPAWEKHKHPATRSFQAIRIFINKELEELDIFLSTVLSVLKDGGRLVVISFHSLEDRLVKKFMARQSKGEPVPPGIPVREVDIKRSMKVISKVKASSVEVKENVRARSAVLRVGEKLS